MTPQSLFSTQSVQSPLRGKRILITRPRAQANEFAQRLSELGAHPIRFPTIHIAPPESYAALDNALAALTNYDWLIFTSVNGVAAFWKRLERIKKQLHALGEIRDWRLQSPISNLNSSTNRLNQNLLNIAAVGPATARALAARGVTVTTLPKKFAASHLPTALDDVQGQRILFPRSDLARETLAAKLRQRGATVDEVVAYRTVPATPDPRGLAELRRGVNAITFTSPSSVNNFVQLMSGGLRYVDPARIRRLGPDGIPLPSLGGAVVACLGPSTARAAHASGLPVDVTASESTLPGLIAALQNHFAQSVIVEENRWTRSLARCL